MASMFDKPEWQTPLGRWVRQNFARYFLAIGGGLLIVMCGIATSHRAQSAPPVPVETAAPAAPQGNEARSKAALATPTPPPVAPPPAVLAVEAAKLFAEYSRDQDRANKKYLDKRIRVTNWKVTDLGPDDRGGTIMGSTLSGEHSGLGCFFPHGASVAASVGALVEVEGTLQGFIQIRDFRAVELDDCALAKKGEGR